MANTFFKLSSLFEFEPMRLSFFHTHTHTNANGEGDTSKEEEKKMKTNEKISIKLTFIHEKEI